MPRAKQQYSVLKFLSFQCFFLVPFLKLTSIKDENTVTGSRSKAKGHRKLNFYIGTRKRLSSILQKFLICHILSSMRTTVKIYWNRIDDCFRILFIGHMK